MWEVHFRVFLALKKHYPCSANLYEASNDVPDQGSHSELSARGIGLPLLLSKNCQFVGETRRQMNMTWGERTNSPKSLMWNWARSSFLSFPHSPLEYSKRTFQKKMLLRFLMESLRGFETRQIQDSWCCQVLENNKCGFHLGKKCLESFLLQLVSKRFHA